ncbi:MAG TPA: restriction endonuclease subunit S [Bacteroidales bacterium]|nr:restriction endonuclease subunit S [Bacteroidales bacterium]
MHKGSQNDEMNNWEDAILNEIATYINRGYSPKYVKQNGHVIINQKCIRDGKIDFSLTKETNKENKITPEKFLKKQDILINSTGVGTAGRVAIFTNNILATADTHVSIVRIDPKVASPLFVFYNLRGRENEIEGIAEGSTGQIELGRERLKLIDIQLPPLPEQRAIASVLSSLDDKIDLLHRQNQTLEAMAETLFRQWFVEEAKDDWEEKSLGDVLDFIVDNRGKTAPTDEYGIPLIATNCVKNENIFPVYDKIRFVSQETYNNWFRSHPAPGDIIFVNKGTPGCVNLVPEPVDFCIAQDMIALRVNKTIINNIFLFLYLRSRTTQHEILNTSVGTTIPHLKKTDLLKFNISIPNHFILEKFEKILRPSFNKMNNNNLQIRTIEALRDTLLPKLMSGEVRV